MKNLSFPFARKKKGTIDKPRHERQTLPFQRFRVLFNSFFKVLFIFRSRYLFAIGLPPIFSFRRNLPPTLICTPKQIDSLRTFRTQVFMENQKEKDGILTLYDATFQWDLLFDSCWRCFYRLQFVFCVGHKKQT